MKSRSLAARCTMCPSDRNCRNYECALFKPDMVSGEPYPCRFVRVFTDGERAYKVEKCKYKYRELYKAHYQHPISGNWMPYKTKLLPCRYSFDRAQTDLNLYACKKGWDIIWPVEGDTVDGKINT